MKRLLLPIALIILGLLEVGAFLTATSFIQLGLATVFYPVIAYLVIRLIPVGTKKRALVRTNNNEAIASLSPEEIGDDEVADANKRAFIGVILTTGIAYFIYSILSRRAELSFIGKATNQGIVTLQDAAGNKVNPAQEQATDGYQISDIDDMDASFVYYGYMKINGAWYITRQDIETGAFRYIRGQSNFESSWRSRSDLRYDYFHNTFSK